MILNTGFFHNTDLLQLGHEQSPVETHKREWLHLQSLHTPIPAHFSRLWFSLLQTMTIGTFFLLPLCTRGRGQVINLGISPSSDEKLNFFSLVSLASYWAVHWFLHIWATGMNFEGQIDQAQFNRTEEISTVVKRSFKKDVKE